MGDEWKDGLCPGIKQKVLDLHDAGFRTTDSGDGTHYRDGMEHAQPYRHVWILVEPSSADAELDRLRQHVSRWEDSACWLVGAFEPGPRGVDTLYVHGIESAAINDAEQQTAERIAAWLRAQTPSVPWNLPSAIRRGDWKEE